jgi:potassium voltage-gated channel Eag-related subfamily H protein 8
MTSFSYFFAMAFKLLLDIQNDIMGWDEYMDPHNEHLSLEEDTGCHFSGVYGLKDLSSYDSVIVLMYYSFTTLTTVGFGDFAPQSDAERIFISIGLVLGVSIFSYILSDFLEMVTNWLKYTDGKDDELDKFLGLLKAFNKNERIDVNLKCKLETYFDYRWQHDKN